MPLNWVLAPCRILGLASLTCYWPKTQKAASRQCGNGIYPSHWFHSILILPPLWIQLTGFLSVEGRVGMEMGSILGDSHSFCETSNTSRGEPYTGYSCKSLWVPNPPYWRQKSPNFCFMSPNFCFMFYYVNFQTWLERTVQWIQVEKRIVQWSPTYP